MAKTRIPENVKSGKERSREPFKEYKHFTVPESPADLKWKAKTSGIRKFNEPGDEVSGIYLGYELRIIDTEGKKNRLYTVQGFDDVDIRFWGSTVIDNNLEDVEPGTAIMIRYLGNAGKGTKKYHNFEIFVAEK